MLLGHGGVQALRDGVDDLIVADREHDRVAQILISLDVRRDADLMDDLRHLHLERRVLRRRVLLPLRLRRVPAQRQDPPGHLARVERLEKIVIGSGTHRLALQCRIVEPAHDHHQRPLSPLRGLHCPLRPVKGPQNADRIQPRQEIIHDHHIR